MPQVLIVGAGISGLALAYRLQQRVPAVAVTVLEQRDRPGGTIWTERQQGFQVETGPNGFLDTTPCTQMLCRDLGLGGRLLSASEVARRQRYLFWKGKLRPLPHNLASFLGSDLLSWRGKLRVLTERFQPRRHEETEESIAAFACRRLGREAATVLADALVTGIHAGDPSLLSMRAAFPRLVDLEARYGSVLKGMAQTARQRRAAAAARGVPYQRGGTMWSFREGLRLLIEALRDRLAQPPALGVRVRRLEKVVSTNPARPTWIIQGEGQDRWTADAVVLTCPAYEQAAILADLDAELAKCIGEIAYNRVAVVALGYRCADVPISVEGFGYIAPQQTRSDVLGVQWCSSIFPDRAPAETVLLRALCGGWHRPEIVDWDDERLLRGVRAELERAMGIRAAPVFHQIVRWHRAIPQYLLGHLERVAWIEARTAQHRGLWLGGNAYRGVALNDCTEQAELHAEQVVRYLLEENHG